jgi:hypothetical protein
VDPAGRFASVDAARLTKAGAKGSVFAFAPTIVPLVLGGLQSLQAIQRFI